MMKKNNRISNVYLILVMIFLYIPIILTVIYSFNENKSPILWTGFSMKWYQELAHDRSMKEALVNSLILAFSSCGLSIILATTAALGMRKRRTKLDQYISHMANLPIMIPEIILGMVFLGVFSFMNLPFGMVTLILAHTTFCVPYIFSMVKARLEGVGMELEEAAYDLGAKPWQVFWDVTLPTILPAILSGAILAFAMSFDDVVISIFVTGASTNTLAIKIYTKMKTGVTPEINALATILLIITIGVILCSRKVRQHGVWQE